MPCGKSGEKANDMLHIASYHIISYHIAFVPRIGASFEIGIISSKPDRISRSKDIDDALAVTALGNPLGQSILGWSRQHIVIALAIVWQN